MKPLIFYHGGCPDGFGGAYAAWKKFGDEAEYIPLHRDEAIPEVSGKDVYFIDFIYEKETMDALQASANRLVALDHHIGVKEITESMREHVFDNDRSGATIAWAYFHPDTPVPTLLTYIEDDDLFRFALPETRGILAYLGVNPFTFEFWDETMRILETTETKEALLQKTAAYAEYFELLADLAADKAQLVQFEGYRCYFATAHPYKPMKSLVGNKIAKKLPPFGLVVAAHPKGFGVSIRGDGSVNVAEIAAKYGGNGHFSSAGFVIPADGPLPWTMVEEDV